MKNAVGREIPEFLLENGKEVYQGKNYMDGKYVRKATPCTRRYEKPQESKIVETIKDALIQCGAKDGMTFSFHHHLREGDFVVNMVMKAAIEELFARESLIIMKKTKRGVGELDLAPNVTEVSVETVSDTELKITALVSAVEPTVNPSNLLDAISQNTPEIAPDFARYMRLEVYDGSMKPFM